MIRPAFFDPPLRSHDPRCPECHGRDNLSDWCRTCGAEAIDLPRNQECPNCTVDGCGGGPLCADEVPELAHLLYRNQEDAQ